MDASLIAKDSGALIDPQNFRAWQLGRHGAAQNADIAVRNVLGQYTGVDGRRQSYDVLPIVAGDVVQWIDPAGFAVERSARADVLLKECNLPLTGKRIADLVITDLGAFTLARHGEPRMALIELADGVPLEEINQDSLLLRHQPQGVAAARAGYYNPAYQQPPNIASKAPGTGLHCCRAMIAARTDTITLISINQRYPTEPK
ncbi:hypothetical protein [Rhizobium leguminosarum]|uniref:hypothetical protein n=1 Tax=Rhizobium leguminosarum TaxID=384 RepID=UPI001954D982|nr:hypothetical protein [Rhizobium leguminosarum]